MPRPGHRVLWCTALFVGIAVMPLTVEANSVNIFNTFGPGYSRDISAGFEVGSPNGVTIGATAMAFTPNITAPLFAVDVAIGSASFTGTPFTLALVTDNGGQPGSVLESWSLTTPFLDFCTSCFETTFSTQNLILKAGIQYWLVASAGVGTDDEWMFNNVGALGTSAFSLDEGKTWGIQNNGSFAAFDVRGIASTPEPSTLALLGSGLLGIAGASRRKFKRSANGHSLSKGMIDAA